MIIESLAGRDEDSAQYKLREGRKLVGFALKNHPEPAVFYENIHQPPLTHLSVEAKNAIASDYAEKYGTSGAEDVLLWGITDVSRLVIGALTHHSGVTKEEALAIVASPHTLTGHALGARTAQERSDELLFNRPGTAYDLSTDHSHIEIIDESLKPDFVRGCPVVSVEHGIPTGDLLFQRFATWAGQLAVTAYFHHRELDAAGEVTNRLRLF